MARSCKESKSPGCTSTTVSTSCRQKALNPWKSMPKQAESITNTYKNIWSAQSRWATVNRGTNAEQSMAKSWQYILEHLSTSSKHWRNRGGRTTRWNKCPAGKRGNRGIGLPIWATDSRLRGNEIRRLGTRRRWSLTNIGTCLCCRIYMSRQIVFYRHFWDCYHFVHDCQSPMGKDMNELSGVRSAINSRSFSR